MRVGSAREAARKLAALSAVNSVSWSGVRRRGCVHVLSVKAILKRERAVAVSALVAAFARTAVAVASCRILMVRSSRVINLCRARVGDWTFYLSLNVEVNVLFFEEKFS